MDENKGYFMIIAIVAIVAIVALVILISGKYHNTDAIKIDNDLTGQASSVLYSEKRVTYNELYDSKGNLVFKHEGQNTITGENYKTVRIDKNKVMFVSANTGTPVYAPGGGYVVELCDCLMNENGGSCTSSCTTTQNSQGTITGCTGTCSGTACAGTSCQQMTLEVTKINMN